MLKHVAIGADAGEAIRGCSSAIAALQNEDFRPFSASEGLPLPATGLGFTVGISRYVVRNPFLAFNGSHVDATSDTGWAVRVISVKPAACTP
ncbi:hypothetical protein KKP04_13760 [Rhodomicrobium sp. Az07]|uniref:hypothetical protein n=1 Tax=Rhodomicrobium sp. Az07 TaxID=2839034 RepID=UPI001BE5FB4D|nr:hypothetical protein [Rhodomicrobium sp. Az07]MBT3071928.1 hypothetical protein [Rhodomicrobium sp. Az07]